jgi:hypothetical protein
LKESFLLPDWLGEIAALPFPEESKTDAWSAGKLDRLVKPPSQQLRVLGY